MKSLKMTHCIFLCICAVSLVAFSACTSPQAAKSYPRLNGSKVKRADMAGPENSTLIFGNVVLWRAFGIGVNKLEFAQVNPELGPMFLRPAQKRTLIYFQPVPVGSCLHLVYWEFTTSSGGGSTITYYSYQGLQRGSDLTFTATKPGLCYVGGYDLQAATSDHKVKWFTPLNNWEFVTDKKTNELDALQKIIRQFKGTAWEPVIASRIKELSNEK